MTPERIALLETLNTQFQNCNSVLRGYSASDADRDNARATIAAIKPQLESLMVMAEFDKKLAEITPFLAIYQDLKPEAIKLIAHGIDEALDLFIQVGNNITKYQEVREAMARSTFATYQAYLTVGFNESQAFVCTIRTMEIFDEAMRKSVSGAKINTPAK
jgi:cell division GTPase FtsZ